MPDIGKRNPQLSKNGLAGGYGGKTVAASAMRNALRLTTGLDGEPATMTRRPLRGERGGNEARVEGAAKQRRSPT
jgi:hypothetical protein